MSVWLLALWACGSATPEPREELLPDRVEATGAEAPVWGIHLEEGDTLQLTAVPQTQDVVVELLPPSGEPRTARSRLAAHASADLRFVVPVAGWYRIRVRSAVPTERGAFTLMRQPPMPGSTCDQLTRLSGGDPWTLPGTEFRDDDPTRRTRVLSRTTDWADRCTVNRLGDLDVGPSCRRTTRDEREALELWIRLESDFEKCHHGWTLSDESDGPSKEWVAELGAALHFLRMRKDDAGEWQVSIGAMPVG